jgi:hypothetical protein
MFTEILDEEQRLIDKLRKIEMLFARTTYAREREAAEIARERIRRRRAELEATERPVEYKFTLPDGWSVSLFIALLHRYGLKPYRRPSQRRTTVMVKVTPSFADEVLWPQFQKLNDTLAEHLNVVTRRIIQEAVHRNGEVEERHAGSEL